MTKLWPFRCMRSTTINSHRFHFTFPPSIHNQITPPQPSTYGRWSSISIFNYYFFLLSDGTSAVLEADKCFGSSEKGGIICPEKHTHFDSSFKGCPFLSLSSISHLKKEREEKRQAWRGVYWLITNSKSADVRAMWTSFNVLTDETAI